MSGVWVKVFPPPPVVKPELPGLGGWAEVSDTPTSTYTDTAGVKWNVWKFTANGTLNVTTAGLLDCLVVGGGAGLLEPDAYPGSGGTTIVGVYTIPAGAIPVVIGAGGANNSVVVNTLSGASSLGTLTAVPTAAVGIGSGWTAAAPRTPLTSSITGTALTYGEANSAACRPNHGDGGSSLSRPGSTGVVIVRRPA
jgi:hypothetical protein